MQSVHWKDITPEKSSDGLLTRVMMTHVSEGHSQGALSCLNHMYQFSHRTMDSDVKRVLHCEPSLMEAWFVTEGHGTLSVNGADYRFGPGNGFIVAPNLTCSITPDPASIPSFFVSSEKSENKRNQVEASGFSVRDYRGAEPIPAHWHHRGYALHDYTSSLEIIESVAVIEMLQMRPSEPHTHDKSFDEVWCMWKGKGVHVVDTELCIQEPGLAVCVTPNALGHNLINHTDSPILCYYVRTNSSL